MHEIKDVGERSFTLAMRMTSKLTESLPRVFEKCEKVVLTFRAYVRYQNPGIYDKIGRGNESKDMYVRGAFPPNKIFAAICPNIHIGLDIFCNRHNLQLLETVRDELNRGTKRYITFGVREPLKYTCEKEKQRS